MDRERLYYSQLQWEKGCFYFVASKHGLCFISSPQNGQQEMEAWVQKHAPKAKLEQIDKLLTPYVEEITAYLSGVQKTLCFSLDKRGTDFQKSVWRELQTIPFGETRSYSAVAQAVGKPRAVRAVASAIAQNPLLFVIPCHRVIHKDGTISGFRSGDDLKKYLLQLEGTLFQ